MLDHFFNKESNNKRSVKVMLFSTLLTVLSSLFLTPVWILLGLNWTGLAGYLGIPNISYWQAFGFVYLVATISFVFGKNNYAGAFSFVKAIAITQSVKK